MGQEKAAALSNRQIALFSLRQYRILKNSHFNLPKSTAKHRLFWHQEEKM